MRRYALSCMLAAVALNWPGAGLALGSGDYRFDVYLDDKKIGSHEYRIRRDGEVVHVESEASFEVKFLFFTAYSYRHTVSESWGGDCLREIAASTTTNGKEQDVVGEADAGQFFIRSKGMERKYDDCVMSFAYWNPAFLQQERLLNPQTGEYLPVDVERVDASMAATIRGTELTEAWRITAKDTDVVVLYTDGRQWFGLESRLDSGRILRYELS